MQCLEKGGSDDNISKPCPTGILVAINFANATLSFYEASKAGDAVEALEGGCMVWQWQ